MKIESISDARMIAHEFYSRRVVGVWNAMYPHLQVRWKSPYDGLTKNSNLPFKLTTYDDPFWTPSYVYVQPVDLTSGKMELVEEASKSEAWVRASLEIGRNEGAVVNALRDLAICCRTTDLERWFTNRSKLLKSKSRHAAKLRGLWPQLQQMANCLSLLR